MYIDYTYCNLNNDDYDAGTCSSLNVMNLLKELNTRKLWCHPQGVSIHQLCKRSHLLYCIYDDDKPEVSMGYIIAETTRDEDNTNLMTIHEIELFEEYQRKGLGTVLLEKLESEYTLHFHDVRKDLHWFFSQYGTTDISID